MFCHLVLLTARLSLCSPAELTYFKLIPNCNNITILYTAQVLTGLLLSSELHFYSSCALSHIQQHQVFAIQTKIYHHSQLEQNQYGQYLPFNA